MILLNGITGNYEKQDRPPNNDGKQFKKICHSIINSNGGKVIKFTEPQIDTNFYIVEVNVFSKHFYILLNSHYPFVAFATNVDLGEIKFIDEPRLVNEFNVFYRVLSTNELNEPLNIKLGSKKNIIENENDLNRAELKQIAFWQPNRIGDVIFNQWD